jgi:hypothetical protein
VVLRVTVDTNVLSRDLERIRSVTRGFHVEIAPTTVTLRERGDPLPNAEPVVKATGVWNESRWGDFVWGPSPPVFETLILDESPLDVGVLGDDDAASRFDAVLAIIGSGSFPRHSDREEISPAQRRQLRDAMILEAHSRDQRDVLVSNDEKAFIRHGRRERLELLCRTKIRTVDEFCAEISSLAAEAASPSGAPPSTSPRGA